MNLKKKKKLIARVLKVGIGRVRLSSEMAKELKEAITRQDMRDLKKEAYEKKEIRGRRKKKKRKTKKRQGKKKKNTRMKREEYVKLTRKLREYVKRLKRQGKLSRENYYELRKRIRAKEFRDLMHLREAIKAMEEAEEG